MKDIYGCAEQFDFRGCLGFVFVFVYPHKRTTRVHKINTRNWDDTLKPTGMGSDHNGWHDVMGDGQMISGLNMAYKGRELQTFSQNSGGLTSPGKRLKHRLTGCKPELQKQLNQTAVRYRKGYEMLERYEGKLSRTVLRR